MWLFKYKYSLAIFLLVSVLYFGLRLPNLTSQPIFADEAIYIRWAQVMRAEPTLRFLPQSDGKTPLFMWLMIPLLKLFRDPLLAGRVLSVFSGYLTLLGAFVLSWRFFNLKVALWSAFLMATVPMILFFDRMALVDTLLSAFSIWSLIAALSLVRYPRLDLAMGLGYLLGGGWLTKTPGLFNLLVLPVTLITFDLNAKARVRRLLQIVGLAIVSILIAQVIMNILRLGPEFSHLNSRNQDYVHPLGRLFQYFPPDPFMSHLNDLRDWFPKLLTWPIMIAIAGGAILSLVKKNRYAITLLLWSLLPLLVLTALLKTYTARYILFPIPPLLCLSAYFIVWLTDLLPKKSIYLAALILILISIFSLSFDLTLVINPLKADLPREESRGYLEDWTAGYGLREIANFLIQEANKKPIIIGTEGYFGTLPDGLYIYLDKASNVSIVPGSATVSATLREASLKHPTFYVANKSRFKGADNIELIKEYPKVKGDGHQQDAMLLYKINPLPETIHN